MRPPLAVILVLYLVVGSAMTKTIKDLTHTFDGNATKYPLGRFNVTKPHYYKMTAVVEKDFGDFWLYFNYVEFMEHQGTHMDAPIHFARGRWATHEIPPERLMGPGVVIDVKEKAAKNIDYAVSVQDIEDYERKFGRIPPNAIIMMNSGWANYYGDPYKVFGTQHINDSTKFHFPGWGLDTCKMLLKDRQVSVLGVDTPSADPGIVYKYHCHVLLQGNNVPLLEYVANLDSIPQNGTTIFVGSIKTRGGSGGPTRIFAVIDDDAPTLGSTSLQVSALTPAAVLFVLASSVWSLV